MLPLREGSATVVDPALQPHPDMGGAVVPHSALDALMAMMSACAPDGYAHARRVARTAMAIARTAELPQPLIDQVEHAALLHDIGKLAIPDPHLEDDDADGELQAALRRQHVRIGFDILSVVPHLRPVAAIVIAVYERWDGFGYPAGLKGREIPIGARIVAVADAYDVLASDHTYRERLSRDEANAEIVRSAGTYFDPDMVRAWLRASDRLECF
ncbi:MAG TPA: HD domain-containing phosphohydrolase [Vicinamibacterales bacterium]|nr:HD domain-containing phosphohydrolase [Vicinamibacterales bacterium]